MKRDQLAVGLHGAPLPERQSARAVAGITLSVFIHCAAWIWLQPLQADVSMHRPREVEPRSSVVVYIQPALRHARHGPVARAGTPAPARQRKFADLKSLAGTQAAPVTTLEEDKAAVADTPIESPVRLNADELKALVKQDLQRERARFGQATGKQEQGGLAADSGQEAFEQARRPKCDDNYKPKVGSVEFSGLMKLPFLLRGALSDKGCKL